MIPSDLLELYAKLHLSLATSEDIVDWAVYRLELGDDSKSLRILASLCYPFDPQEIERVFPIVTKEMNAESPPKGTCLKLYTILIVEGMRHEEISLEDGMYLIFRVASELKFPGQFRFWDLPSDEKPKLSRLAKWLSKNRIIKDANSLAEDLTKELRGLGWEFLPDRSAIHRK